MQQHPQSRKHKKLDAITQKTNLIWSRDKSKDIKKAEPFLLYPGKETVEKTLQATTQLGKISHRIPMRQHLKTRNPLLNCNRLML